MEAQQILATLERFAVPQIKGQSTEISKFTNGFWFRRGFDFRQFLETSHRKKSKRMRLNLKLNLFKFAKSVTINSSLSKSPIDALRVANGALLVWAGDEFYKLPIDEKCEDRIVKAEQNFSELQKSNVKSFITPIEFLHSSGKMYQKSVRGQFVPISIDGITKMDEFLLRYFQEACGDTKAKLRRGYQHGDLQINNIIEFNNRQIGVIDLDQFDANGYPFLDIISTAIHFIGYYYWDDYFKSLEALVSEGMAYANYLDRVGFKRLAQCWRNNYSTDYLKLFFTNRLTWFESNQHEIKFRKRFYKMLESLDEKVS